MFREHNYIEKGTFAFNSMNAYISGHVYCLTEPLYLKTILKLLCVSLIYVKPLHNSNTVILFLAFYQALAIGISCCMPEK